MIAEIIPATKTINLNTFSYLVPDDFKGQIKIGSLVKISFGKRFIYGIVFSLSNDTKNDLKLKEINNIVDNFRLPEEYIEAAKWVSNHYFCTLGEAISLFLPKEMKRPKIVAKKEIDNSSLKEIIFSSEQQKIYEEIKISFQNDKKPVLLYGVTGSGKTELYIRLALDTIKLGKQVIVLIPEIILTPQTVERFARSFGEEISIMHSRLSNSERYKCYYDFYLGKTNIIIGPRSALLVPSNRLGLIIVDEEQEDSFKQEQSPRYHAVALAEKISKLCGADLLLGTATPRIESFYKTASGSWGLKVIAKRHQKEQMPESKIVDMRDEIKKGNFSPISEILKQEMAIVLKQEKQVLLYMNRRGSATFVSCRDCGYVLNCPNCSIPLVYHIYGGDNALSCHHCDYKQKVPSKCPNCGSTKIKYFGAGIEKIADETKTIFPAAKIELIDSVIARKKDYYDYFYQRLKEKKVDIIIGTQMIAKGLDIPGIELVGVISADVGLNIPQFRSGEKAYSLLTQVSGRSGRDKSLGKTIIQTYWPEALPILCASKHDFQSFYNNEIIERKKFAYPPFSMLIRVISENRNEKKAFEEIEKLHQEFLKQQINFIGPGPCFYQKLNNKYRFHILIKEQKEKREVIKNIALEYPQFVWDVDPVNLL